MIRSVFVMSLAFAASAFAQTSPVDRRIGTASEQTEQLVRRPTFGVAFAPPAQWQAFTNDKAKTIAQWISPDSKPGQIRAMVMIEGGKASASLDQTAKSMAADWGGVADPKAITLDGERAIRVTAKADGRRMRPLVGVVALHQGVLYMVMGGGASERQCVPQVEAILKSWKWLPFESVSGNLALGADLIPACGGAMDIRMPAIAHIYREDDSASQTVIGVSDFRRNAPVMICNVQCAPNDSPFDQLQANFLAGIQQKIQFKTVPVWHEGSASPSGLKSVVTQACEVAVPKGPQTAGGTTKIKWAMVKLDETRVVLINFTLSGQTPQEQESIDKAAEEMVASIQVTMQQ